jgi:multidrug resistance efflux pump
MTHMLEDMKITLEEVVAELIEKIERSSDQSTTIDITGEFRKIFQRIMIKIVLGEDILDQ